MRTHCADGHAGGLLRGRIYNRTKKAVGRPQSNPAESAGLTAQKLATTFGVKPRTIESDGQFARARSQPGISVAMVLNKHGTNQHTKKDKGDEVTLSPPLERGNSRDYLTARLNRDHPQVFLISLFKPTS